jgi:hypothetical protein
MVSQEGVHVFNRDGHQLDVDPFSFYPKLAVEQDASHAFYLGVELGRAQIAWQLGKRYVQDEELSWGINKVSEKQSKKTHRQVSLAEKKLKNNDI